MKHGQTPFTQHHQKTRCSTRGIFQKTETFCNFQKLSLEPPPFLMSVAAHTARAAYPLFRARGCHASASVDPLTQGSAPGEAMCTGA